MKKLLALLATVTLSYITTAQEVQVRGKVVSVSKKQMADTGNITIKTYYPLHTAVILSDRKLAIDDMKNTVIYHLFDKDTAKIDGSWVISYMAKRGGKLRMIAASEINGCPGHIKIAIFLLDDKNYYMEYLVRVIHLK